MIATMWWVIEQVAKHLPYIVDKIEQIVGGG